MRPKRSRRLLAQSGAGRIEHNQVGRELGGALGEEASVVVRMHFTLCGTLCRRSAKECGEASTAIT